MKKTAVDWLFDQMPDGYRLTRDGYEAYTNAKEMEKEQIKEAYVDGLDYAINEYDKDAESYYTKKYGVQNDGLD